MPKRCKTSAEIVNNDKTENSTEIMAKLGIDGLQLYVIAFSRQNDWTSKCHYKALDVTVNQRIIP